MIRQGSGVIAVWKPPGLATQAPPGIPSAESWLRGVVYGDSAGYLGVPHRLDRAVSGVLLFAATPRAARKLSRQFERRLVQKTYWAIVVPLRGATGADVVGPALGHPDAGDITGAVTVWRDRIEKLPDEPRARIVHESSPGGREALTRVRLVQRWPDGRCMLELEPVTGRMHQLRIQSSARGLPVFGDSLYGGGAVSPGERMPPSDAIALHARRIAYLDPDCGTPIAIEAALPDTWPRSFSGR